MFLGGPILQSPFDKFYFISKLIQNVTFSHFSVVILKCNIFSSSQWSLGALSHELFLAIYLSVFFLDSFGKSAK